VGGGGGGGVGGCVWGVGVGGGWVGGGGGGGGGWFGGGGVGVVGGGDPNTLSPQKNKKRGEHNCHQNGLLLVGTLTRYILKLREVLPLPGTTIQVLHFVNQV